MITILTQIPIQYFWIGLVIILAIIEIFTQGLTTIWFAIAAFIMTFLSFIIVSLPVQILLFLCIASVMLIFTRPLALKKFKVGSVKTNIDILIGKHAILLKSISDTEAGEIKIDGQIWSAGSEQNSAISKGTKCEIMRIEGVKLIVRPLEEVL